MRYELELIHSEEFFLIECDAWVEVISEAVAGDYDNAPDPSDEIIHFSDVLDITSGGYQDRPEWLTDAMIENELIKILL
jgi:hypothetical protein